MGDDLQPWGPGDLSPRMIRPGQSNEQRPSQMAASFVARIPWNTKGVVFLPERTQLIPGAQPACLIILEHELDARLSVRHVTVPDRTALCRRAGTIGGGDRRDNPHGQEFKSMRASVEGRKLAGRDLT